MNTILSLLGELLFVAGLGYYIYKCVKTKYNPLNLYALIPAAGIMITFAIIFFGCAVKNITPFIICAVILNVILLVVHSAIHFHYYKSVPFAVCNYGVQAIMAGLAIMTFGLVFGLFLVGINLLGSDRRL